ncbi:MAG: helix-turn-helix domain-containing protein [Thermoguttaceae bacterium]|jgi:transcriptional regulator with AAA-type ATPase domain|nr:helix-turn-helix domain-containing protein [Thermoguttaceae bacterium]
MGRSRTPATELARRLDSGDAPLYVVDARYTLVFLNKAAKEWLGTAADGLPGTRCLYTSASPGEGPTAIAAGLCPPPEAMSGTAVESSVAVPVSDGNVLTCRMRFIPLGTTPEDVLGVVAMAVSDADGALASETPQSEPADEPGPLQLHELLRRFRREAAARYGAGHLVGESPAVCLARRQVELAAGCCESVLILGPPGSGRRHTAAAIHYGAKAGGSGRLVPLECAVLPAELIYSTIRSLASGEDGRDTTGGSLLLCDADLLPLEVHGALARSLGKHSFPLRLMATAEKPPGELARRGKYEPELAAMLSTISIELPPLSERRRDLPVLAQQFVEQCNGEGGRQLGGFTPEALDLLTSCPWPGNLDELGAAVREAHQRAAGPLITADDLPPSVRLGLRAAGARASRKEEAIVLSEFLGRIERELIRRAVAQAKGNKAKAARLLGLTRPRLYRRMVQLDLEP